MTSAEIVDILYREVQAATKRLSDARLQFDTTVQEIPSGFPAPDGQLRIQVAGKALRVAQDEMFRAVSRYSAWTLNGIVPEDVKKLAQAKKPN